MQSNTFLYFLHSFNTQSLFFSSLLFLLFQKFFQIVSLMLDIENLEKWEDAHQVTRPSSALAIHLPISDRKTQLFISVCREF